MRAASGTRSWLLASERLPHDTDVKKRYRVRRVGRLLYERKLLFSVTLLSSVSQNARTPLGSGGGWGRPGGSVHLCGFPALKRHLPLPRRLRPPCQHHGRTPLSSSATGCIDLHCIIQQRAVIHGLMDGLARGLSLPAAPGLTKITPLPPFFFLKFACI